MRKLHILVISLVWIVAAASRSAPAAKPDFSPCDGLMGVERGLCVGGVAAGCATGEGDSQACSQIEETYESVTGQPPPWLVPIPAEVLDALDIWFDGFQNEGNSEMALTPFQDGFEYAGCVTSSAIGFDRSFLLGNTFFAYLSEPQFTVVAEITDLEPSLEEPIKEAIEDEALDRGIPIGAPGTPCP